MDSLYSESIMHYYHFFFYFTADSLTQEELQNTFVMSNMAPQYADHNNRQLHIMQMFSYIIIVNNMTYLPQLKLFH